MNPYKIILKVLNIDNLKKKHKTLFVEFVTFMKISYLITMV